MRSRSLMAALAATMFVAAPAAAHPKLVSSQPSAGSEVSKLTRVSLIFSEKLVPQFSGFDLMMTGMPGMSNHAPMKIQGYKTEVGADGKSLNAVLPRALPAGTYELSWHAVAADTHRIEGAFGFSVK